MRGLLIIVFLLKAYTLLHAQNPGYLGKKISIEINGLFSISNANRAFNSVRSSTDESKAKRILKDRKYSFRTEIHFDYSITRRLSLGVFGSVSQHKFTYNNFSVLMGEQGDGVTGRYKTFISNEDIYMMMVKEAGLSLRVYGKKHISPVGFYNEFRIGVIQSVLSKSVDGIMTESSLSIIVNDLSYEYTVPNRPFNFLKIGYSLGRKIVFKHGFYLNLSASLNLVLGRYKFKGRGELDKTSWYYHYNMGYTERKFLFKDNFFQYKAGFGLIF
ncbi:MAG: hypothetical protein COA33_013975 [Fluviicola sp.]|nr:hypothetical protein [Fluviicola sp.]